MHDIALVSRVKNTVYQEAEGALFMATYRFIHVDSSDDHRLDVVCSTTDNQP